MRIVGYVKDDIALYGAAVYELEWAPGIQVTVRWGSIVEACTEDGLTWVGKTF